MSTTPSNEDQNTLHRVDIGEDQKQLLVVQGANPSLLMNDMAVRRGRKLHLATNLNTTISKVFDRNVRTLCNLIVYDTPSTHKDHYKQADCGNCLRIAKDRRLL